MPPVTPVTGLLYSQIGYDLGGPKRAVIRGEKNTLDSAGAWFAVARFGETNAILEGDAPFWGEVWGSAWWIADFSALDTEGEYVLIVSDAQGERFRSEPFALGENLLWRRTWKQVGIEQAERRAKLANGGNGWYDAGTAWQEANSHAALIIGFCDALEFAAEQISEKDRARIEAQILNGCDYLARLQDLAAKLPGGEGAVVHQSWKFDTLILPADVSKAALSWTMAARRLPNRHLAKRNEYTARAKRAMQWLRTAKPMGKVGFSALNHGARPDAPVPEEWMTRDLLMQMGAALELTQAGAEDLQAECVALAEIILRRQISQNQPEGPYYGHFRTFDSVTYTEKAWIHQGEGNVWGADIGGHFPHYLLPLLTMCEIWPDHPQASRWRKALHDFAYGYLLPACRANPFNLLPLGYFQGQGLLSFAGLWHGMNGAYALAAALGMEFARFFGDGAFREIAVGNLQWIVGLNAGVTKESLFASVIFSADIPAGAALPCSMIHGIGTHQAGSWLNLRGAICNGFSVGEQFRFDADATWEADGPHAFTDEDWISHAGGWLSGIARFQTRPD